MKQFPRCANCGQYYVSNNLGCPSCSNIGREKVKISPKIAKISQKLNLTDKPTGVQKNNTVNPPPPPVPPRLNSKAEITAEYQGEQEPSDSVSTNQSVDFTIFRRGVVMVFDRATFQLISQIPWIKHIQNSIEIRFQKLLIVNDSEKKIEIILRMKVIYIPEEFEHNVEQFLDQGLLHEEVSVKISPSFLIIKNTPLNHAWYKFLAFSRQSQKIFVYLTRNNMDQRHYLSYGLDNVENMFIGLIKSVLGFREATNIDIVKDLSNVQILNPEISTNIYPDIGIIDINVNEEINYCMGHGGVIKTSKKSKQCEICSGWLCEVCREEFYICPASLFTVNIHKFT